ncbi:MAG TPA: hypothetical protein VEU08_00835 [Vicinamibacterales bacterium]|nr:hypothetical protein [Vicinamibacterales bacterium]
MSALSAFRDGAARVSRAPLVLVGVWMLTFAVSLPLAIVLRGMISDHLGASMAADTAASGVNLEWLQEFREQATGLGVTLKPTVVGVGAVLDNLSAFIDDTTRPVVIVGAAGAYIFLWLFVAGGIIDRYARDRPTHAYGFFSASGVFFFRFLRLGAVQWLVYAFLFGPMHSWLFGDLYFGMIHDVSVERTAFFARALLYLVFGVVLCSCAVIFDYAKVRAVVEDRRSALGAISAAIGFIQRNCAAAVTLFAVNFLTFAAVIAAYALVAPGVGGAGLSMWAAFGLGQLYVLARLWTKLAFWASETALFQSRLAHAGFVARPAPVWPESPAAEAIKTLG